jgi:hypothetical protein
MLGSSLEQSDIPSRDVNPVEAPATREADKSLLEELRRLQRVLTRGVEAFEESDAEGTLVFLTGVRDGIERFIPRITDIS